MELWAHPEFDFPGDISAIKMQTLQECGGWSFRGPGKCQGLKDLAFLNLSISCWLFILQGRTPNLGSGTDCLWLNIPPCEEIQAGCP